MFVIINYIFQLNTRLPFVVAFFRKEIRMIHIIIWEDETREAVYGKIEEVTEYANRVQEETGRRYKWIA